MYDLIIIGAGSAGMSAAIYAGRAKLNTLVIERDRPGGQIRITSTIENYPGLPSVSGEELSRAMRKQAASFGAKFINAVVESVDFRGEIKRVTTTSGPYEALAVIVASGAMPRSAGFKGESDYLGRGVAICATCDGEFFVDMDLFVIGGGFAAAEEALFLTRFARSITLIVRGDSLKVPRRVADSVFAHPKITVRFNTEIQEAGGDERLRFALFRDNKTGETWRYEPTQPDESFGIFVFAGYVPQTAEYAKALRLDDNGYIPTDESMRTNVDGVYAAGDVRPKELHQLVTAVSDGAIAATNAEMYVDALRARLGMPALGTAEAEAELATQTAQTQNPEALVCPTKQDVAEGPEALVCPAGTTQSAGATSGAGSDPLVCPATGDDDSPEVLTCPAAADSAAADMAQDRGSSAGGPLSDDDSQSVSAMASTNKSPVPTAQFFDSELVAELEPVLARFQNEVGITAILDDSQDLDARMRDFVTEFVALTSKVKATFLASGVDTQCEEELGARLLPSLVLTDAAGKPLGVQFHGVPTGHEINPFVQALYYASGAVQKLDASQAQRIASLTRPLNIKVGVSLSCTLCPDVVAHTQLIALHNPFVVAEMIDVAHFPQFKGHWGIMSVPAVVINDERVAFGKRDMNGLLSLLGV
ncbi:MAG: FAD-dependent oxidoreductase [Coriobacteriales bacterium]|jgi:thioredoxin-disulfide reductase|nr:FAD-dependent oxidoreductase [Coriobacteriales bacterium]